MNKDPKKGEWGLSKMKTKVVWVVLVAQNSSAF